MNRGHGSRGFHGYFIIVALAAVGERPFQGRVTLLITI
jgi:hypothetical protein